MSTHTYARCFPTWQRFQILLLPLNTKPCFWTPTKTQPHSNAHILCSKQHSSIVSHECAPGGGGTSGALIWTFVLVWGTERVDLFGGAVASVGNKGSLNYSTCKAEVFQNYLMSFYLREINFAPLCTLLTSNMLRICDFCIIFLATAQCVAVWSSMYNLAVWDCVTGKSPKKEPSRKFASMKVCFQPREGAKIIHAPRCDSTD